MKEYFSYNLPKHLNLCDRSNPKGAEPQPYWQMVGDGLEAHYVSLRFSDNGTPYAAYVDKTNGQPLVVKYNGVGWEKVSESGFPANGRYSNFVALAIDNEAAPHLACTQIIPGNKKNVIVKRFNGDNWEEVGNTSFINGYVIGDSLRFDGNGDLYMASLHNDRYLSVLKLNSRDNWEEVCNLNVHGQLELFFFLLDKSGLPVVLYSGYNRSEFIVFRYTGENWVRVGIAEPLGGSASLTLDNNGIPYAAYRENDGGQLKVVRFNGSTWDEATKVEIDARQVLLKFDNNGRLHLAYSDRDYQISVARFNGVNWETMGDFGFFSGVLGGLTFDRQGVPYLVCVNGSKRFIMKFAR